MNPYNMLYGWDNVMSVFLSVCVDMGQVGSGISVCQTAQITKSFATLSHPTALAVKKNIYTFKQIIKQSFF